MLLWIILIPAIASALIGLCKFPGRPTAIASATLSLLLSLAAICCPAGASSEPSMLQFTLDLPLSRVMLLLTALVTFAAALGLRAPSPEAARSWAISMLLISCGAAGAFMSDSIIAFYGFHELALIPTFIMIGLYGRGDRRSIAWTATIYLGAASMILLAGIVLLCHQMGTYSFSEMKLAVAAGTMPSSPVLIGGLLLLGFGTLVSLFPFHSWAAPAYASAPTPVAMLHAGVLKKFGLYGLFTIAYIFGDSCTELFMPWNKWLLLCLLGNVLWVGYVTINKNRLDTMLGNSSVMHMGFLFLGFAAYINFSAVNELAFVGAAILMLAHGLSIALLFLLCGQIESQTKTLELDSMGGLGSKLPKLGFLFGLAGFASIGLPLLANFPGELSIFLSCFQGAEMGASSCSACPFSWLGCLFGGVGPLQIAAICSMWGLVIGAIYMLRAYRRIFMGEVQKASSRATTLSCLDISSAIILAAALLLFGLCPWIISNLIAG